MKTFSAVAFVGLVLAACSHRGSEPVRGPDGEQGWWAVSCSHGADNCWKEAGDRCPGGYVTADEHQSTTTAAFGSRYGVYAFPKQTGEMLVKCMNRGEALR